VSIYVLIAIVKKRLDLEVSLYTLLQILSVSLFEKIPIQQAGEHASSNACCHCDGPVTEVSGPVVDLQGHAVRSPGNLHSKMEGFPIPAYRKDRS
jgi:hypothetical protein